MFGAEYLAGVVLTIGLLMLWLMNHKNRPEARCKTCGRPLDNKPKTISLVIPLPE